MILIPLGIPEAQSICGRLKSPTVRALLALLAEFVKASRSVALSCLIPSSPYSQKTSRSLDGISSVTAQTWTFLMHNLAWHSALLKPSQMRKANPSLKFQLFLSRQQAQKLCPTASGALLCQLSSGSSENGNITLISCRRKLRPLVSSTAQGGTDQCQPASFAYCNAREFSRLCRQNQCRNAR